MTFAAWSITLCPVPIGLNASVIAFCSQLIFKSLDVKPVPRKKEAGLVNLQEVRSKEREVWKRLSIFTKTFKSIWV